MKRVYRKQLITRNSTKKGSTETEQSSWRTGAQTHETLASSPRFEFSRRDRAESKTARLISEHERRGGPGGERRGSKQADLSNSWSESSMPPRSRRLLSERRGASAGSLATAPRLPPLAFAFAFPAADIAGAPAGDRRLALACECLGLPPCGVVRS